MSGRIEEQDFTAQRVDLTVWKRLYRYALRNRGLVAAVLLSLVVVALVDVAYPLLSRYAIDRFVTPRTSAGLGRFALAYAACVLVQGVGTFLFISRSGRMEMEIAYAIRQEAFEKLQTLSFSFYDRTAVGYLMARMISDVGRLSEMVAWSLVDVLYALFYVASSIVTIFSLNWRLALVVVAVIPPLALVSVFLQRRILYYQRRARRQNSRITGAFNEGIMGAKTTKTLVREERNAQEFGELTEEMRRVSIRASLLSAAFFPLVISLGAIGTGCALMLGSAGALNGQTAFVGAITVGTLVSFISYATQMFDPIQQIAGIFAELQDAQASAERVIALLDTLEYLMRGGRIPRAVGFVGGVLSIKPVIAIEDGKIEMLGRARGSRNSNNLLSEQIRQCGGVDFSMPYALGYTGVSDALLQKYIRDSAALWEGQADALPYHPVGATIGTHAGPGAIAVAFFHR